MGIKVLKAITIILTIILIIVVGYLVYLYNK